MVETGKRVMVIADNEVIGTGVILAKDKHVLSLVPYTLQLRAEHDRKRPSKLMDSPY